MSIARDIEIIRQQERELVFSEFDEHVAHALAMTIRRRAKDHGLAIACGIRLWDRPLVYFGMPGATADNEHWIRRKSNVVQRLQKPSYRARLENNDERNFPPHRNLPIEDFALSGGSFPIRVQRVGIIGAATVSGLHERVDHEIVVRAMCELLELDSERLALPPLEA